MANSYFQFKEFRIEQEKSAMKVTTDGCLFGAWVAARHENKTIGSILDIGTGTGLITLMLAQKIKSKFDAVEIDKNAAAEASQNFQNSKWTKRITLHHLPIQEFNPNYKFDVIVCNPPFFNQNLKGQSKSKNLAIHNDELSIIQLIQQIDRFLSPNGSAYILYPPYEMELFIAEAKLSGLSLNSLLNIHDIVNRPSIRTMVEFSRNKKITHSNKLVIKEAEGYTEEFKNLLKDYYLHL